MFFHLHKVDACELVCYELNEFISRNPISIIQQATKTTFSQKHEIIDKGKMVDLNEDSAHGLQHSKFSFEH